MDLFGDLNESQRQAVAIAQGPALVLAGPGSGKTRVLTHRVAFLVREVGIRPKEIVAVTFTNKAAREMKERLLALLGPECEALTIGTFHAICARILRREAGHVGFSSSYSIYDTDDQQAVVKRVLKAMNLDDKTNRPGAILNGISKAKNDLIAPDQYTPGSYQEEVIARVYVRYQQALVESNAMDFDDLLMYTARIFQDNAEVLARYRRRYSHILVDEFQDTNAAQYILLKLLSGEHRNLFAVADEDQSIYSWRGADFRNIQRFRKDFPEAQVILLERNYRSTQTILEAANSVISRNIHRTPKRLHTDRGAGASLEVREVYDEQEEGQFVVNEILRLVEDGNARPGECAVMYRTNAQSRAVEEAFLRAGQPYKLIGATRFYERREIKDALAYLRILHNPADSVSLNRIINVPPRGLGGQTVSALFLWAGDMGMSAWDALRLLRTAEDDGSGHPFSGRALRPLLKFLDLWEGLVEESARLDAASILSAILDKTDYRAYLGDGTEEGRERWDNVMELLGVAGQYSNMEDSLTAFLQEVSLVSDVDDLGEQPDTPVLLTLHTAKGLEFPVVFIIGLEEGILPHSRSSTSPEELEEERRLFYVGITRAKDRLYLLRAFRRAAYGRSELAEASPFLRDIPQSLLEGDGQQTTWVSRRTGFSAARPSMSGPRFGRQEVRLTSSPPSELSFKAGDIVRHPKFGEGTVVKSDILADDEQVVVSFPTKGVKTLLARFARLEKVR